MLKAYRDGVTALVQGTAPTLGPWLTRRTPRWERPKVRLCRVATSIWHANVS